jgi:nitrite reductase/ring-hydroxylating ferredoxin subunit
MPIHYLCRSNELAIGEKKSFEIGGQKLVLYHLSNGFFATQASCTHVFAPLARGKIIEDREIQCPFHRARFDIRTGEVACWANFPPGVQILNVIRGKKSLRTFKIIETNDEVTVQLP